MPEICRFFGIVVEMYFDDHNPPHFHAKYAGMMAEIDIRTLGVTVGKLPPRVLGFVVEWAAQHRDELMENWDRAREHRTLQRIAPLE